MWVRQCDLDAESDCPSPIPTRIVSNEEFIPPPQTPQQREVEQRLSDLSDRAARRLGLSRRQFLRSGGGMAAALVAMNQVFGPCYDVAADEVDDPQAVAQRPGVECAARARVPATDDRIVIAPRTRRDRG